ncbi:MAG TPA: hypothetical protein VEA63_05920, partial [Opitutus sp.]|nr:hypothetical protein [Opitutus sp.]
SFQLYYRGALAIVSGLYRKNGLTDGYGNDYTKNYYWRSIAHNTLLVHNPAEEFVETYGNDGGQRVPNQRREARTLDMLLDPENGYRTGEVLAHGFGPEAPMPDYTLLQGDISAAYSEKVKSATRSFVFLNLRNSVVPAALITLDRVVSAEPDFRKYWLLHTMEEPTIDGTSASVERTTHGDSGRLNLDVLLPGPDNTLLEKVGGPGKEYWVFGKNHPNDVDPATMAKGTIEAGAWRLELSPKTPATEDVFLAVMQVTDRETGERWPARRIDAGERAGCVLTGQGNAWVVLMRKDSTRSAQPVEFSFEGEGRARVLVTDLAPGRWQATRTGGGEQTIVEVGADSGAAWFEGSAGTWTLRVL